MIKVSDVAGRDKYINCDLIERIEANPDTVIFLVNGHNFILKDKPEEVVEKIVAFKRRCLEGVSAERAAALQEPAEASAPVAE